MPRPMQGIGDINSGGGFILTGYAGCINGVRPTACIGDIVSPHDRKPTHFAVVGTGNPRCIVGGRPVARLGDLDSCIHIRLMGYPKALC